MVRIGAFEAKTHFSQLLSKVEKGEVIIITRHGETIAKLIPFHSKEEGATTKALKVVTAIRQLRKGVKLGKNLSIKKMIEDGRK